MVTTLMSCIAKLFIAVPSLLRLSLSEWSSGCVPNQDRAWIVAGPGLRQCGGRHNVFKLVQYLTRYGMHELFITFTSHRNWLKMI